MQASSFRIIVALSVTMRLTTACGGDGSSAMKEEPSTDAVDSGGVGPSLPDMDAGGDTNPGALDAATELEAAAPDDNATPLADLTQAEWTELCRESTKAADTMNLAVGACRIGYLNYESYRPQDCAPTDTACENGAVPSDPELCGGFPAPDCPTITRGDLRACFESRRVRHEKAAALSLCDPEIEDLAAESAECMKVAAVCPQA